MGKPLLGRQVAGVSHDGHPLPSTFTWQTAELGCSAKSKLHNSGSKLCSLFIHHLDNQGRLLQPGPIWALPFSLVSLSRPVPASGNIPLESNRNVIEFSSVPSNSYIGEAHEPILLMDSNSPYWKLQICIESVFPSNAVSPWAT